MAIDFIQRATATVFSGSYIPSHDETHELAEQIAGLVGQFHAYVMSVRDGDQADNAVAELLGALVSDRVPSKLELVDRAIRAYETRHRNDMVYAQPSRAMSMVVGVGRPDPVVYLRNVNGPLATYRLRTDRRRTNGSLRRIA